MHLQTEFTFAALAVALLAVAPRARAQEMTFSARVIDVHLEGRGTEYTQDGAAIEDLSSAVSRSPRAEKLIRRASREALSGHILIYSGLAAAIIGLAGCSAVAAQVFWFPTTWSMLWSMLVRYVSLVYPWTIVAVVGEGLALVGVRLMIGSRNDTQAAVDAYNSDLSNGRLDPPAVRGLPQS